jgi:hypothetical protein
MVDTTVCVVVIGITGVVASIVAPNETKRRIVESGLLIATEMNGEPTAQPSVGDNMYTELRYGGAAGTAGNERPISAGARVMCVHAKPSQ